MKKVLFAALAALAVLSGSALAAVPADPAVPTMALTQEQLRSTSADAVPDSLCVLAIAEDIQTCTFLISARGCAPEVEGVLQSSALRMLASSTFLSACIARPARDAPS